MDGGKPGWSTSSSHHATGPHPLRSGSGRESAAALAPRAQAHEILRETEEESGLPCVGIVECAVHVTDALLDELPDIRVRSLVRQWVKDYAHTQTDIQRRSYVSHLLDAVSRVMRRFESKEAHVRPPLQQDA